MKKIIIIIFISLSFFSCIERDDIDKKKTKKVNNIDYKLYGKKNKKLWAKSFLGKKAPNLVVEEWIFRKPDMNNKFILLDFWGTSCHQCRKLVPMLNKLHNKFKDDLVIIGLSGESKSRITNFLKKEKMDYYKAYDSKNITKRKYQIRGIPHVVIIAPNGIVVWEGYPFLSSDRLTEKKIKKILENK